MKKPELDSPSLTPAAVSKQPVWAWPYYCHHRPQTLSFRLPGHVLNTESPAPSSSSSPSHPVSPAVRGTSSLESVIRSARSDRLFFNPGATSSSILNEASSSRPHLPLPGPKPPVDDDDDEETVPPPSLPYNDSVFLSMDSRDPLLDFRESMTEMITAHGIKDWDGLVELLWWYLKVNDATNHSYIYGAFIDLSFIRAVFSVDPTKGNSNSSSSSCECSPETLPADPPCARHYSPSSPLSFDTSSSSVASSSSSSLSTRCVSGLEIEDLDKEKL